MRLSAFSQTGGTSSFESLELLKFLVGMLAFWCRAIEIPPSQLQMWSWLARGPFAGFWIPVLALSFLNSTASSLVFLEIGLGPKRIQGSGP